MKTIFEALHWASSYLTEAGRDQNAADILLADQLKMERSKLLASFHDAMPENDFLQFKKSVEMHQSGVPVQYITGKEWFYGREFLVNEHVLIPRPETEEVVEAVLSGSNQVFPEKECLKTVDVGTGSGAIAVTLALESKRFSVTAADISEEALRTAEHNAKRLGAKVDFICGDLLQPLMIQSKKADVIVSNPPYISEEEMRTLSDVVRLHEPVGALTDGADGLRFYYRLMMELPEVIADKALIVFEIGWTQGNAVRDMFQQFFPKAEVQVKKDLNGKDRIVWAVIEHCS
ncbi:peptide chain release factor N(5)-glutamine methyltransferase [Bacillus swezeyi]|uniref:Release factor glutamine methyltransferase n=1 Tax=Bacillus swezeyi TaxID=1925020 RepID=A0A5M8RYY7_9BACI|nr:peptide chain release factor N(5)-glutamine methyltransferase [Bacillus swezeyi]KAA6451032.1 peptide chain release factor N(5)-glutamine methyltransferase [Bacillus swezeyi]KAA6474837.1 peptide chain release factor N(5)-glutamine methyltransferase [Bacillus swezeyi]TYS37504.1 peptide chain release factor N(5)-glutamine methyltransferase [Bacillus swezeyi]